MPATLSARQLALMRLATYLLIAFSLLRLLFVAQWAYAGLQIVSPQTFALGFPTLMQLPCSGQDLGLYLVQRNNLQTQMGKDDFADWLAGYETEDWRILKSLTRGSYQVTANAHANANTLVELNPIITIYRSSRSVFYTVDVVGDANQLSVRMFGEAYIVLCVRWTSGLCLPVNLPLRAWPSVVPHCVAERLRRSR